MADTRLGLNHLVRPVHPVVRARWLVLALFAALCAWWGPGIGHVEHDDDVLAFLPPHHGDVVAFQEVADRFGMLSVALVGLRADGASFFEPGRTEQVRSLARQVGELGGVRLVLSYPDLPDAHVEDDGLVVDLLVPEGLAHSDAIAARVLGNSNAVGNLVAADGTAAALMVYLIEDLPPARRREQLDRIRELCRHGWDGELFFGGAPFIEDTAARSSREDIARLSPVVIAVLGVASAVLLRSVVGALVNLVVTGLGVALILGAHGRFGEPLTIVSSTMPVLVVALGGAFGMHLVAGYQRQVGTPPQRASAALRELWLPVVLSGITTAVAFFVLVVMPQVPMQRFGVAAGCGVLLLLALALALTPALLAILPAAALPARVSSPRALRHVPPLWTLLLAAVLGAFAATRMTADADTRHVFDPSSEPARADAFFAAHFGGSQFVQIAIETSLREPTALRRIRDVVEAVRAVEGVADIRSLIEPVALLTEGLGGRAGVPKTPAQAARVITMLADQAPMAQLMTPDGGGAIIHVKLVEQGAVVVGEVVARIEDAVRPFADRGLRVGSADDPRVRAIMGRSVAQRLSTTTGTPVDGEGLQARLLAADRLPNVVVEALRDRALGTDELIEPLPAAAFAHLDPRVLARLDADTLAAWLRLALPQLYQGDPEGVGIVAEQLHGWIVDARRDHGVRQLCASLGVAEQGPRCEDVSGVVSELEDPEWACDAACESARTRAVPWSLRVTGQPIVGAAFAQSVTTSLIYSTVVSLLVLVVLLAALGHARAVLPAVWTLCVSAGVVACLGHPISVGTSMVACVGLGAGVDFAIHLGVRARALGSGRAAVEGLGGVAIVTGLQLALAFAVLGASSMPPLRHFGVDLAIALLCAAVGAVWLTPSLYRTSPR